VPVEDVDGEELAKSGAASRDHVSRFASLPRIKTCIIILLYGSQPLTITR